ncbi:MAG: diguanylate cyclase [Bacillota bacterium]|nr:diguanylate cyclase [Bacillota bacterium]
MILKKSLKELLTALYNHVSKNFGKYAFCGIILIAGASFTTSAIHSNLLLIYPVLFTGFLLLANFWNGRLLLKYFFLILAFISFYLPVEFYNIEILYVERTAYYLPLIFSYLLPDAVSPNIAGLLLAQMFSTYFGKDDTDIVTGNILQILYVSAAFSTIFYLFRKLSFERDRYHKLSITDSLTGLLNLNHFMDTSTELLGKTPEAAVLLIDIDNFKQLNDTYGHIAGNKILIEFSDLLKKELMGINCIIARLAGDQFVILLYGLRPNQPGTIIDRLYLSAGNKIFYVKPTLPPLRISFTIGQALSTSNKSLTIQELLNQSESNMYSNKYGEYKLSYNSMLNKTNLTEKCRRLLKALEEKDTYTYIHSQYVAQYAAELAAAYGLPERSVKDIYISGLLHDIGKLYIPIEILRKPWVLTPEEYSIIWDHVDDGLDMLKSMQLPEAMLNGISYHHERFDGTGYPYGIKGKETPIEGLIMQVADAFSAMTIRRAYTESLSLDAAILELRKNSGSQFDPALTDTFIELFNNKSSVI